MGLRTKKKGRRRSHFPDHLPSISTRFELSPEQLTCPCGGTLHEIGVEETKELERIEVTVIHKLQRVKYACRSCQAGVTTAPGPARVIEKGLLASGFLATVAVEPFGNHMPYPALTEPDLAGEAIARIRRLFGIERRAKNENLDADARLALRQGESVPVLDELHVWLGAAETKVLPKSSMATAVGYALRQWDALNVFDTESHQSPPFSIPSRDTESHQSPPF